MKGRNERARHKDREELNWNEASTLSKTAYLSIGRAVETEGKDTFPSAESPRNGAS